jgi:hypothetical protein
VQGTFQRAAFEERGASVDVRFPVTLESNVYQSLLRFNLDTEVRQTRFFGGPLSEPTPFTTRITLNPSVVAGYRLQQNPRDVVPNSGLVLGAQGEFDAWTERGPGSQYVVPFLDAYVPVLRSSNTGIRLGARTLFQNRDALVNTTTFVPRGYEDEADVLADGTFLQLEAEVTQPVWYIDGGLTIVPFYAKALSVYGFGETLGRVTDGAWRHSFSSVGGGLSLQTRLFYTLNFDFRLGVAYKPQAQEVTPIVR